VYDALYDDLNTPVALANLFEGVKKINSAYDKKETLTAEDLQKLKTFYHTVVYEILGLKDEAEDKSSEYLEKVIQILLNIRQEARKNKNFELSDAIRDELLKAGIIIKDGKDGSTWELAE
jgi:cysteinyl-tRNA synthetase